MFVAAAAAAFIIIDFEFKAGTTRLLLSSSLWFKAYTLFVAEEKCVATVGLLLADRPTHHIGVD